MASQTNENAPASASEEALSEDTTPISTPPQGRIEPLVNEDNGNIPMKSCACERCGKKWFERKDGKDGTQGPLCPMCKHLAGVTAPEREALGRAQARCKEAAAELRTAAAAVREQPQGVGLASLDDIEVALQKVERVVALYEFMAKLLEGEHDDSIREMIAATAQARKAFAGQIGAGAPADDPMAQLLLTICNGDYDDALVRLVNGGP